MTPDPSAATSIAGPSGIRLVVARSWPAFEPWAPAWEALLKKQVQRTPFHEADWLRVAWAATAQPKTVALVARGDDLLAGFCFCRQWELRNLLYAPARVLHCLPHLPALYPPCAAVIAAPDAPADVISWGLEQTLRRLTWDALVISHVNERTAWFEAALRAVAGRRGWAVRETPGWPEVIVDFSDGPEAYWQTRSSHRRRRVRSDERRLAKRGAVRLRDLHAEGAPWEEVWRRIEGVYRVSWQAGSGLYPFDEPMRAVNVRLLGELYERGRLRPLLLCVDDQAVAYGLWLAGEDTLYGLAIGIDPAYREDGPGSALFSMMISQTHEQGFRKIHLGQLTDWGHIEYKKQWLTHAEEHRLLIIVRPWSLYGALDRALEKCGPARRLWLRFGLGDRVRGAFTWVRGLRRKRS